MQRSALVRRKALSTRRCEAMRDFTASVLALLQHETRLPPPVRAAAKAAFDGEAARLRQELETSAAEAERKITCVSCSGSSAPPSMLPSACILCWLTPRGRRIGSVLRRRAFEEDVAPRLKAGAATAKEGALATATQWSIPVTQGGLHWATYKATTRRNGVWRLNMNEALVEPVFKAVATQWERTFLSGLSVTLDGLHKGVVRVSEPPPLDHTPGTRTRTLTSHHASAHSNTSLVHHPRVSLTAARACFS